jgi:hypothetical protein
MPEVGTLDELEKLIGSYTKIEDDRGFKIKGNLVELYLNLPYVVILKANVVFPQLENSRNQLQYDIDYFQFGFSSIQWVNFTKNGETYTYRPVR